MKLTKAAILALKGSGSEGKKVLAAALGVEPSTIYRYIANNDSNLTKAASVATIRELTGLPDSEILETENENITAA